MQTCLVIFNHLKIIYRNMIIITVEMLLEFKINLTTFLIDTPFFVLLFISISLVIDYCHCFSFKTII